MQRQRQRQAHLFAGETVADAQYIPPDQIRPPVRANLSQAVQRFKGK